MFRKHFHEDCHAQEDRHFHGCRERRHARDALGGRGFGQGLGRGHHHFGGKFGRGRLGRFFDHGDLRFVILGLIAEKPRHGYEVIKAIEEKLGGAYSPSPGVVYPTLTLLEELGYASVSASEGNKKLYSITPEGTAFLDQNRPMVESIFNRIAEVSASHGGGPAPQILRAMENLKMAIRLRLAQGPLSDTQIQGITAAIDKAAQDIERN